MTKQQRPIVPDPELLQEWYDDKTDYFTDMIRAAQWGADQELEACCHYFARDLRESLALELRAARRPKPPSLKQQALEAVKQIPVEPNGGPWYTAMETIIRALETLDD
jgi:hypothetical protein